MAGTLAPSPVFTGLDNSGVPLSAGLLYTYASGGTTPATTYNDVDLAPGHANANPIVLDSAGRCVIYLSSGSSYKFVLKTSAGSTIWTQDAISTVPSSSANQDVTGTTGEAILAGEAVYLSDGSGSKTAGLWYHGDSANTYSSTLPQVGIAPSGIASGASGTMRMGGAMTGLSGLTLGATYYIGTAGALTATAPHNSRVLGVADTTTSLIMNPNPPAVDVTNLLQIEAMGF